MVTLTDLERAAWAASGWSQPQQVVDELLKTAEQYARDHCGGDLSVGEFTEVEVEPAQPVAVTVEPEVVEVPVIVIEPLVEAPAVQEAGDLDVVMKTCRGCNITMPRDENFAPTKSNTTGFQPRCRPCMREARRRYDKNRTR